MCRVNQALEPGRVAAVFVGSSPVPHLSGASKPTLVQNHPLMSAYLLVRPDRIRVRYHFLPKALIEAKRPAPHCCAKRQQLCAYATQLLGRFIDMGPVQSQLNCSAQYMQKNRRAISSRFAFIHLQGLGVFFHALGRIVTTVPKAGGTRIVRILLVEGITSIIQT